MTTSIDLTGQKFARLTVTAYAGRTPANKIKWHCLCACGNTSVVVGGDLRRGKTRSCGCCVRRIDLTGQKFGKLTVTGYANESRWHCLCSCGNTSVVDGKSLREGRTHSCGCIHRPDLTGQKFARLTVTAYAGRTPAGKSKWHCVCSCGNTPIVVGGALRSGTTRSCGCIAREDLTGRKFGKLTVTAYAGPSSSRTSLWTCSCSCGNTMTTRADHLKSGKARGCKKCARLIDLTGKVFNQLTVVSRSDRRDGRSWNCLCSCGKSAVVHSANLHKGQKSCGCAKFNTPEEAALRRCAYSMGRQLVRALRSKKLEKKGRTAKIFGYTQQQLKEHLENLFKPGMTWLNYGKWHVDHVVPLSSAQTYAEITELYSLENLQPLWASENRRKHAMSLAVWLRREGKREAVGK